MYISKVVTVLLLILCGCATSTSSSSWRNNPDVKIAVEWHRTLGTAYFEQGVCHYFAKDDEESLKGVWHQIEWCLEARKKSNVFNVVISGKAIKVVSVFFVEGPRALQQRFVDINGMQALRSIEKAMQVAEVKRSLTCMEDRGCSYFEGFSFGSTNIVLIRGIEEIAGHELKHVYDGEFHDRYQKWH